MIKLTRDIFIKLAFTGLITGIVASFIGAGTEILIVPLLIYLKVFTDYKTAVGTSLASLLLPIGIVAVYFYATSDNCKTRDCVQWPAALIISLFFIIGTMASYYTVQIDGTIFKQIFAVFMIILGIVMLIEDKIPSYF